MQKKIGKVKARRGYFFGPPAAAEAFGARYSEIEEELGERMYPMPSAQRWQKLEIF